MACKACIDASQRAGLATTYKLQHGMAKVFAAMKSPGKTPGTQHRHRRRFGHAQDQPAPGNQVEKSHDSLCCITCGVVYRRGRWHWAPKPADAQPCECPACQRIHTRVPAGIVTLSGQGVTAHAKEMKQLARHQEEAEKGEHPLNRIIDVEDTPQGVTILTTDIHLPRRIGQAIRRAFGGILRVKFEENGHSVTVDWISPDLKKQDGKGTAG